ncbi:hypothetical protein CLOM_g1940 [Closterium sp. NIES-68]|nr:hypothetical protein CLOM_g1940 [Closterium sp. NIES-68]GJP82467.1 hypothetical protein CLOP_g12724 [Closterium sp. NIES-67]
MATSLVTIRDPASLTTSPVLLSHPRSLSGTDRSARSYLIQRDLERPSRQVRRLTVSISAGRPLEFQPSIQSQQVPFTPPVAACQQTSDLSFEKESDNSDKSNAAIGTSTHCPYPFARIAAVALAAASCSLLLALSPAVAAGGNDGLLDIQTLRPRQQEQINESYVKRDGQDLSVSDLQGATFMEASLRGTDLHGSDLRGAMFTKSGAERGRPAQCCTARGVDGSH